ncbi:hypothetical protein GOV08_02530 [Candidatus Woesearchaeota archaeon]|nr:hypothetical protein [Candidatus Woesearchaeota archaeon]
MDNYVAGNPKKQRGPNLGHKVLYPCLFGLALIVNGCAISNMANPIDYLINYYNPEDTNKIYTDKDPCNIKYEEEKQRIFERIVESDSL